MEAEIEREKVRREEAEASKAALSFELERTKEHNRLMAEESRHMREQLTRMLEEHRLMWEAIKRVEAEEESREPGVSGSQTENLGSTQDL